MMMMMMMSIIILTRHCGSSGTCCNDGILIQIGRGRCGPPPILLRYWMKRRITSIMMIVDTTTEPYRYLIQLLLAVIRQCVILCVTCVRSLCDQPRNGRDSIGMNVNPNTTTSTTHVVTTTTGCAG